MNVLLNLTASQPQPQLCLYSPFIYFYYNYIQVFGGCLRRGAIGFAWETSGLDGDDYYIALKRGKDEKEYLKTSTGASSIVLAVRIKYRGEVEVTMWYSSAARMVFSLAIASAKGALSSTK